MAEEVIIPPKVDKPTASPNDQLNSIAASLAKAKPAEPAKVEELKKIVEEELPAQLRSEIDEPKKEVKTKPKVENKKEEKQEAKTIKVVKTTDDGKESESDIPVIEESERSDFLSQIEEPKEEPAAEVKTKSKTKEKPVSLPKEVEEELSILREIAKSEEYRLAKEFRAKGKKGAKEFAKQFDSPDFNSMTPPQVWEINLKNQGIEGDDLKELMDEFNDLSPAKQKIATNPIKAALQKESDENVRNLLSEPSEAQIQAFQKVQQEAAGEAVQKLDEMIEKTFSKGYFGYKPTREELEEIKDAVMNNENTLAADGKSYDVVPAFHRAIRNNDKVFKKMLKKSYEYGKYDGYDEFIKGRIRVDKNDFTRSSVTASGKQEGFSAYMATKQVVKPS